MDSKADLYFKRAKNELEISEILQLISNDPKFKNLFPVSLDSTYYSAVISHAYYAIFYSAKAMLFCEGLETCAPEVHKKTLHAFKQTFIDTGFLDAKLFMMYQNMIIRAEALLEIFKKEKRKRGTFTYHTLAQANREPAEESYLHAKTFIKHAQMYLLSQ